jgi:molybdopterin synthase catalytic subunit
MQVRVLYFGILREIFSAAEASVEVRSGATVAQLLAEQAKLAILPEGLWNSIAVSVNREYAQASNILREGDEVALLPPVSGGAPEIRVALTHQPIDAAALSAEIRAGEDGAVLVFEGIVRNNTRGRRTLYLDYSAYEEMALRQMQQLAERAIKDFGVRAVTIMHRLGRMEVGETSVLIAVASAHRAAAYEASRWLIDTLKKTVPIWKREHFEDGAVWVAGEAFPAEILPGGQGSVS